MRQMYYLLLFILMPLAYGVVSCSDSKEQEMLNRAEMLIESNPDSALRLLFSIDRRDFYNKRQRAQYALMMSMALDKNSIDTTTFDVLKPAIDYYLKYGSSDEKLRTYYYQGRIFQNQGDGDNALESFTNGIDMYQKMTDSLCFARTLMARACIYYDYYDFTGYVNDCLEAASIYNSLSFYDRAYDCLLNAFGGSIILEDRKRADSLYNVCNKFCSLCPDNPELNRLLQNCNISYVTTFQSVQTIKDYIQNLEVDTLRMSNGMLNLALAFHKIGNNLKARELINYVRDNGLAFDTLKYHAVAVPILKSLGDNEEALLMYENFTRRNDSINRWKFDQKSKSIYEKHRLELKEIAEAQYTSRVIWWCVFGVAILCLVVVILFLVVLRNKAKKELALERVRVSDAENARLMSEKDLLILENKGLQLERDKKALEAENLAHKVEVIENEAESLKVLMSDKEELPVEVRKEIKIRIEMLNSLLASYITNNDQYEKSYDIWIKELTENRYEFMNSNRLAFQASHPRFVKYFEEHGLSTDEINYVCLYAIGLRGKEVGKYMRRPGHVNTSSAIRKKLGIDKHETNIGIYVRKLLRTL